MSSLNYVGMLFVLAIASLIFGLIAAIVEDGKNNPDFKVCIGLLVISTLFFMLAIGLMR